jgi:hypothetical protein
MQKFNEFEALLIKEGLNKVKEEMIAEVKAAEASGKTPIMTAGFIDMSVHELIMKVEGMSKKSK